MADSTPAPQTASAAADPSTNSIKSQSAQFDPSSAAPLLFPNPNPTAPPPPSVLNPPNPLIQPSFRTAAPPVPVPSPAAPQFSPVTYQTPGVPPPGLAMASPPAPAIGGAPVPQVQAAGVHTAMAPPYAAAGQTMRFAPPMMNGYPAMPHSIPQGVMPPGVPRYSYPQMIRPGFPPRPMIGAMPLLARPPIVGIRGPILPPGVRPPVVPIAAAEEPHTTVYVGKISSTVDNDFMLSVLQLCGPVKNWRRPQDPTGSLKGFGFCEFESAEGVLRALRLLNKLSIDGQELMLNVNQTTRKYLESYVEKKAESSKKEPKTEGAEKGETIALGTANATETLKSSEEPPKLFSEEQKKDGDESNKENTDTANFGLVTDEDRDADREACEKLTGMLDERLRKNPLPPPPPQRDVDGPGNSHSEQSSGSKGSDDDMAKNDSEDKNEDDRTGESKPSSEMERIDTGSPDSYRRHDKNRDRDRKERELERYEREREEERSKREKEREYRSREDERRYKAREKDWEAKERDREHRRKIEREREKQKAQERKWIITDQEREGDDGYGKKRKHKIGDEQRKRRLREKEEDLVDRLREEEEIAEAKVREQEELEKKQLEVLKTIQPAIRHVKALSPNDERHLEDGETKINHGTYEAGENVLQNGAGDDFVTSNSDMDVQQGRNLPTRKLGFGLSGSGKRGAAVPSVFKEDEDEEAHKDKKMKPLVPIDYSTEEQGTQPSVSEIPTESVKRISTANTKEEKSDVEKDRSKRHHERSSHRDRDRHEVETNRKDNLDRERSNKTKTTENKKLLDAKQLIDTIPKTKDELFSYKINWATYDQSMLHERMRPWILKKINDYLGEEEVTLVDYIISSTQEHVEATEMLERLQTILDDEAEMFVLKMWRMLIFEIKKVETGIAPKPKA